MFDIKVVGTLHKAKMIYLHEKTRTITFQKLICSVA